MSRYSFIDDNINISGKQCFCIDANSKNSPFVGTSQANLPTIYSDSSTRSDSSTSSDSPTRSDSPTFSDSPTSSDSSHHLGHADRVISNSKSKSARKIKSGESYMLTPEVIGLSREQKMIQQMDRLLNQTYTNISNGSQIQAANEPIIDITKNSLTIDPNSEKNEKINLNTMANDKYIGKKTYRKSTSNLDLFEGFENKGCTNVCKPKKSNKFNKYIKSNKSNESNVLNENFYLFIIIVIFLVCSWFSK